MDSSHDAAAFVLHGSRPQASKAVDAAAQTTSVTTREAATAPAGRQAAETQTDAAGAAPALDLAALRFDGWAASDAELQFLRRAADAVEAALGDNVDFPTDLLSGAHADVDDDIGCIYVGALAFSQPDEAELRKPPSSRAGPGQATAVEAAVAARPRFLGLPCSSVAWNATGSLLAGGFGGQDHTGWCKHRAGVGVWNFHGAGTVAAAAPAASAPASSPTADTATASSSASHFASSGVPPASVLETPTCVCSVAWHPERPGVLAAGTFGGEVFVWDLNREEADGETLVARSRSDDYFHREPVLRVEWAWHASAGAYVLASASAEGKVLLWQPLDAAGSGGLDYPLQAFQPAAVPAQPSKASAALAAKEGGEGGGDSDDDEGAKGRRRGGGARGKAGGPGAAVVVGVASLAFALDGQSAGAFFIGAENGAVYKCRGAQGGGGAGGAAARQLVRAGAIVGADSSLPWEAAAAAAVTRIPIAERPKIVREIERHARDAGLKAVSMTAVYDARPDPRVLFPNPIAFAYAPHAGAALALASSPFHRNLFASAGLDGRVCLYSALSASPLLVLQPSRGARVCSITGLAWSKVRPMVLAAASGDGHVYVYDLYASTGRPAVVLRGDGAVLSAAGTALAAAPPHVALPAVGSGATGRAPAGGSDARSSTGFYSAAFNPRQRRLFATGDADGIVRVFKLGWRVAAPQASEELLLSRFVDSAVLDASEAGAGDTDGPSAAGSGAASGDRKDGRGQDDGEAPVNSISSFLRSVAAGHAGGASGADLL